MPMKCMFLLRWFHRNFECSARRTPRTTPVGGVAPGCGSSSCRTHPALTVFDALGPREVASWEVRQAALVAAALGVRVASTKKAWDSGCTRMAKASSALSGPWTSSTAARSASSTLPRYDGNFRTHRETIKGRLNAYFKYVYPAGRAGLHTDNNRDRVAAVFVARRLRQKMAPP